MKKNKIALAVVLSLALAFTGTAWAGPTQDDAVALIKAATEFLKANGKEKAFAEFSDPKGKFVQGDLYVFVVDYQGVTLAHGGNAKLVGKDMTGLKDADGKPFMQAMIDKAKAGGGWVDYKWTNPATRKVQDKTTFVQPIEGGNFLLGCGLYK